MTEQATETSVRRTVTIEASREHAFGVFTDGFGSWWPKTHHIGQTEPQTVIVEPRAGGRCYEVGQDGVAKCTGSQPGDKRSYNVQFGR